jgi:AcrR family transcriptional regulator
VQLTGGQLSAGMPRARSAEAKLARREQILSAAVELLSHERFEQLTMASVANAAGLAKGTPYLYWRTKEEMFLAALQEEYGAFLAGLKVAIRAADGTPEAVADAMVGELLPRQRLISMIGLLHAVLEHNASVETVLGFKRALVMGGLEVAVALNERMPWLALDRAARLLVRMHGAIVAFQQMGDPPEAIRKALEHPDLALLRVDLATDLRELVLDLLIAAKARRGDG